MPTNEHDRSNRIKVARQLKRLAFRLGQRDHKPTGQSIDIYLPSNDSGPGQILLHTPLIIAQRVFDTLKDANSCLIMSTKTSQLIAIATMLQGVIRWMRKERRTRGENFPRKIEDSDQTLPAIRQALAYPFFRKGANELSCHEFSRPSYHIMHIVRCSGNPLPLGCSTSALNPTRHAHLLISVEG